MTGFGAGEAELASHPLRIELRAVNHRHLDVRVRVPNELGDVAHTIEDVVRAQCARGRIEAQASWRGGGPAGAELDLERARRAYQRLLELRDELAPGEPVQLATLFALPGLFASRTWPREEAEAAVRTAGERAVAELTAMRAREGEALTRDIGARLTLLRARAESVAALRPTVLASASRRLQQRVEKLLEGSAVALDPARLAQEAAWFAERSDVAEELTRFRSHLDEFDRALENPGEAVGRKLEFVVQELGRELNTLGAKANDSEIARLVIEMKAELERIREQVQNIL